MLGLGLGQVSHWNKLQTNISVGAHKCVCVCKLQKVIASFAMAFLPCCVNGVTFDLLIDSEATLVTCLLPIFLFPAPLIIISFFFCYFSVSLSVTICSLMKARPSSLWGKGSDPPMHRYTHAHINIEAWMEHIHTHKQRGHMQTCTHPCG